MPASLQCDLKCVKGAEVEDDYIHIDPTWAVLVFQAHCGQSAHSSLLSGVPMARQRCKLPVVLRHGVHRMGRTCPNHTMVTLG